MRKKIWVLCSFWLLAAFSVAHADTKISALPDATAITGTEQVPVVQSAATVKTTPSALNTYVVGQLTSANVISKWSGFCNSGTYLRADGACAQPPAAPAGANYQIQFNRAGSLTGQTDLRYDYNTHYITVGDATQAITTGGIMGGASNATGNGVAFTVRGGDGGSTSGNGGDVAVVGGTPVNGNGGLTYLYGGSAAGTNHNGGTISLNGGTSTGTGAAGNIALFAGNSVSAQGGQIVIKGGKATTNGIGGDVSITAGDGFGTDQNGGSITLQVGAPTGTGTGGALIITNANSTGTSTASFSASNKPGSSNVTTPALWIKVQVSGSVYWMPLFAN